MISRVRGTLLRRELDRVEVLTPGGVGYNIEIPRTVHDRLPKEGEDVELRTVQVVRDDAITLYGFNDGAERNVFARLLTASGVGPKLALSMLSTMAPARLVRAILDRDVRTLRQIPGFGAKKAEKLVVEMNDRLGDLDLTPSAAPAAGRAAEEAIAALVALGYVHADASAAVSEALEDGAAAGGVELVKAALSRLGGR